MKQYKNWFINPGNKIENNKQRFRLHNFPELAQSLVQNKMLFRSCKKLSTALTARNIKATSNLFAWHIITSSLTILDSSSFYKHNTLLHFDKYYETRHTKSNTMISLNTHGRLLTDKNIKYSEKL